MNVILLSIVCQDISAKCKAYASVKYCATNKIVQKRCQKSCNRCSKYLMKYWKLKAPETSNSYESMYSEQ